MSKGIQDFLIWTALIGIVLATFVLTIGVGLILIDGLGISEFPISTLNRYLVGGGLAYLWIYFGGYYLGTQPPKKEDGGE